MPGMGQKRCLQIPSVPASAPTLHLAVSVSCCHAAYLPVCRLEWVRAVQLQPLYCPQVLLQRGQQQLLQLAPGQHLTGSH